MRAIHAILRAAKVILGLTGNKPAAVAVGAADVAVTTIESIIAQVKTHGADGASMVFLESSGQISAPLFREYGKALREAFEADHAKTGADLPRVVVLPPGLTMEVVKETAEQLAHAAEYLSKQKENA